MRLLKNNWQFLAIVVPVLLVLYSEAKNFGASDNRVDEIDTRLSNYIKKNDCEYKELTKSVNGLTSNVVRLNTYLEIYFVDRGIKIDEKVKR